MAIIASWSGNGLGAGAFTAASVGVGDSTPTLHGTSASSLTVDPTGWRPPRVKHTQVASNPSAWYLDFTSQTASAGRVYFEIVSGGTLTTQTIIQINNGATRACSIYMTSTGVFRVYNQANVILQSSAAGVIVAGTLYRIEWTITGGTSTSGSVQCKLFAGNSATPLATVGGTNIDVLTAHSRVYFGNTAATPTMPIHWWDDVAIGDSAVELGAVLTPPRPTQTTVAAFRAATR